MKLSTRYSLYSLLASAIPLFGLLVVLMGFTRRELTSLDQADLRMRSRVANSQLETSKSRLRSDLSKLSNDIELKRMVIQKDSSGSVDQLALIERASALNQVLGLDIVEIIDTNGILLARSDDFSNFGIAVDRRIRTDKSDTSGVEIYFTFDEIAGKQRFFMVGTARVQYNRTVVAYVAAMESLGDSVLNRIQELVGCYAYFGQPGVATVFPASRRDSVEKLYNTDCRLSLVSLDSTRSQSLVLMLPQSGASQLLRKSLLLYSIVATAGVILAGIIGYYAGKRLTVPLNELVSAAAGISRGEFTNRIIWFANDELGVLVSGFNSMFDRLKRSQEKLVQAEKVAAWEQMARKVAHEIRNPLTPIKVSVEDLKRSFDARDPKFADILDEAVVTIGREIARLNRMTAEFSKFAKLPEPVLVSRDLRRVIGDALRIYGEKIRDGVLRVRFPQNEVRVKVDAELFSQALVNLVKNGFEAIVDGGRVDVVLDKGERVARILVEDNGVGVSDENAAKLFSPHFTSKPDGSGLGLVIAQRIAFDHGGRIRYEKRQAGGSRFVIVLPLINRDGDSCEQENTDS